MLKARLDRGDKLELIDVRDSWEFDICRIDGSRNIPMMQIESSLQTIDASVDTIVICHHGMRSMQVASYLENLGYQRMINLDGGIHRWALIVDPDMPQY